MKASVIDLRYRMNDVLKALGRNENVQILYHGKVKGVISPGREKTTRSVRQHPFFKMSKSSESVAHQMESLRGGRHHAL